MSSGSPFLIDARIAGYWLGRKDISVVREGILWPSKVSRWSVSAASEA
jgi:hypothetical protein